MKKKILVFFMLIAAFFFLITAPNNNDNSNNLIEIKEAEAVNNHTGGYIYFDNSKTQWSDSYIYLCIGHDSYTSLYKMTKVANTNLYYTELGVWDNATYCAIIGTSSSWGSGAWGPGNRTNASHYTNVYNDWTFNSGGNYLITTTSSTNNTGITIGYYANGVNHTVGVEKHSTDGIGINTVKVSGRKLSAGGNSLDAASSGTSVAIAYSTNATLTATVKDGYSFLGWYDSNGNRVSSDATCSVTVTAEKTYYARAYRILPSGESLYFIPNNAWKGNSARFAAYFYNHIGGSTWVNLSKGTNDYYSFSVPSGDWTNFKIVRMDPNNVANNWENDWSETAPLTFDGTKNLFFITSTNTTSGVETSCDSMILNLKTVYFATDASGWSNVYVKARLGAGSNPIDYETQMDIVNSLEGFDNATYDFYYSSTQTSSALTIFKAEIPVIYDVFNNLEFDNEDSFTDAYNVTHGFSEGDDGNQYIHYDDFDGKLFFYDKLDTNSGWKTKTSAIFHMNEPNTEARTVTAYGFSGEAVGAPSTNKIGDYVFAGWYDNEGCEGVSLSAPQLVANETNYYASWGIPFNSGTIYCIPNSTWLASGTVAVNMYGSGQNNWFNMNKHTNSDGTVIYSLDIQEDSVYTNVIFTWVSSEVTPGPNAQYNTNWSLVKGQTNDLTSDDVADGYLITGSKTVSGKLRYTGECKEIGSVKINYYNGTDIYNVLYYSGYTFSRIIDAPAGKSFIGMVDAGGTSVLPTGNYTISNSDVEYTASWKEEEFAITDLDVYYKECSVKENSYGVIPIYAKMNFFVDISTVSYVGNGALSYCLNLDGSTSSDVTKSQTVEFTYADIVAQTNFNKEYTFTFTVTDSKGNIVHRSDATTRFRDVVDEYILLQRNTTDEYDYVWDLENDYEDKAVYQLHIHSYADEEDVNKKYINDAYYLYRNCNVCGHKEKVDGVTVSYNIVDGQYVYTTTIEEQIYTKTYPSLLTYIYEDKNEYYSSDTRNDVYVALTKNGELINQFKSLYAAIEACFDYDEKVKDFNINGLGSYVVKLIDGEYDDRILFRNKLSYINDSNSENTDMYWYYNEGASLQRYGYWENDYWTSLLANNKFISIQRMADLKNTENVDEASINGHAASYEIFAANSSVLNYDISEVYNYNYSLDSAASIFLTPGLTSVRYWFNLKDSQIYPSYHDSDKAWAYIGYASATEDFIVHQGLKCDTTTGNWYYYVGKVSNSNNEIVIEEIDIPGITDVCYMTSTFNSQNGYFSPNENLNLAMGINVSETSAGSAVYNFTMTLTMVFEDGRTINKEFTAQSRESACSIRLTMGLDVDTSNDLADYMCGAEFKNLVVTYGRAYSSSTGTVTNIHNIYTSSGYQVTEINRNSTLYNNIVSSIQTGNNGALCSYDSSVDNGDMITTPIYYGTSDGTERRVPVYNFSYRSIDSNANPFASKIQNVMDEIQEVYNIETIVQNEFVDPTNKEVSYIEYHQKYNANYDLYATLVDQERTVLQMSYPDDDYGNKYNRFLYETKIDVDKILEFEYRALGNVYNTTNSKHELGGQLSYNTKTDTHMLLLSLPLYGRVELIDNYKILTTANATAEQQLVTVSGLYNSKKRADWTQNLYTDGNDYTFYCSKAIGSSYLIEYNWSTSSITIKQSPYQTLNYVGPYHTTTSTGTILTKSDRLTYKVEIDAGVEDYGAENVSYDPLTGVYSVSVRLSDWDGVYLYYDGVQITPTNTQIKGLWGSNLDNRLYWADDSASKQRFMRADYGDWFNYRLIYDPINNCLYIAGNDIGTISGFVSETYSDALSYWAPDSVLHSPNANQQEGWKTVLKSDGTTATANANGYRLYLVADSAGRICYMVVYPTNGFGGINSHGYYTHPLYRDYRNNPAFVTTDDYATWSLVVPEGGFGVTIHQDKTNQEYINILLSYLTHGFVTSHGGIETQRTINNRYAIDHGFRVSMSDDHTSLTVSYEFS